MKTAVDYIFEQLEENALFFKGIDNELNISISASDYLDIKRLAKEMEKQQMNHIVDTNKMVSDKVLFEQATVAMEEHYGYGCETEIDAYFRGAKWMQKQFIKNTEQ